MLPSLQPVQIVLGVFLCKIIVHEGASSFDENLCPPSAIFRWGNKNKSLGDRSGDGHLEDGQAVQTVVRGFSPWQQLRCERVRCLGKTGFSFSANVVVFPQVLPPACEIIMHRMFLQLFFLFEDNG